MPDRSSLPFEAQGVARADNAEIRREELAGLIENLLAEIARAVREDDDARVKELDGRLQALERDPRTQLFGPVPPHWTVSVRTR